jgi:hypothetical protein
MRIWSVHPECLDARGLVAVWRERLLAQAALGRLTVSRAQLELEWRHLMEKLRSRDPRRHAELVGVKSPRPHPLFRVVRRHRALGARSPVTARGTPCCTW